MGDAKLLKEIGVRIQKRRKELNLTQEKLAEQMDVSVQMISNLELGKKAIRPENLIKLSRVLRISTDYILCGTAYSSETDDPSLSLSRLSQEDRLLVKQLTERLSRHS